MTPDSNELLARLDAGAEPAPDAMREALKLAREEMVLAIAFLGRDVGTDRQTQTLHQLIARLATADKAARAALSAPATPSDDVRSALADDFAKQFPAALSQYSQFKIVDWFVAALRSAPVSAPATLIESFARLQRRLMSYCNHANAGHMPSDAREFARRIQLGFLAAYEEAGVAPLAIAPETHTEYMAALRAPAVGVTREAMIDIIADRIFNDDFQDLDGNKQDACGGVADAILALFPAPDTTVSEPIKPRRLLDDDEPNGYFESDDDWIRNNQAAVLAFLEVGVASSPQDVGKEASVSDKISPHYYSPSLAHQGDCAVCGHLRDSALHIMPEATISARDAVIEEPGFDFYECKVCGFSSVQAADFKGSDECPICAGDCGHSNTMSRRTARSTDKPEGKDARSLASGAKP